MEQEGKNEPKNPQGENSLIDSPVIHIKRAQKNVRPHRVLPEVGPIHRMLPRDEQGNLIPKKK
jgi:hypothetical protein